MADEPAGRTSLGVLHEILNNLGDSNQYHYVVEALEALKNLLGEGGIGEAVSDWLEAHPEASTTVQNGSITLLKLANDVKSAINGKAESSDLQTLADNLEALAQTVAEKADASDLDDKADIDGYYSQLTAGLAENLIGRGDAVPAEYLYRTAGGDADIEDGIATVSCIKGNTLVWNQMNQNNGASNSTGLTRTFNSDGSVTIDGTSNATGEFVIGDSVQVYKDHKYLVKGCPAGGSSATYYIGISVFVVDTGAGGIWTAGSNAVSHFKFVVKSEQTFNNVSFYPQLFDLTLMFGAGNEPATVEEFEAMFPLPYYPYSAPKLLPVDIRGVETVGFNLWDEELEVGVYNSTTGAKSVSTDYVRSANKIHVFPNTTYCFNVVDKSVTVYFYTYDESGAYRQTSIGISSGGTFVVPNGIHYFAFALKVSQYGSTTYQNDICINLSWSGYRNGEYEEHWSAERPIDTSRFFPTGLKKVGDKADALYADHYDTVIGAVDLGTLTWAVNNTYGYYTEGIKAIIKKPVDTYHAINMVCVGRTVGTFAQLSSGGRSTDLIAVYTDGALCFSSDIATEADFKAAMSGVILYYELATPTTTEIDPPLNLSYKVSDFGTERIMVDETADAPQTAPVPMEVEYGINAIDTIRRLPTEYQSHKSMGQLTAALESSLGIDITETWDEDDQRYEYEATPFELADGSIPDSKLVQTGGVLEEVANIDTFLNKETSIAYSRNMFNIAAITDGLLQSDGSVVPTTNRVTSDFIPVTSGTAYRSCYWNGSGTTNLTIRACVYYDADKNVIGDGPTTVTGTFEATDLAYIRYSITQNDSTYAMLLLTDTSTSGITEFIPYSEATVISYGKKYRVVANGDSITFGHKPSADGYDGMTNGVSYMTMACEALGYELDNYSISMSTLALDADGNDTHQALVNRYQSMSNDADLVYIAIGSNDWFYSTGTGAMQLGTSDDRTNDTFYGAMHTLCAGLKAKYGTIPILFATPIKRWIIRDGSSIPGNLNGRSKAISEWVTAIKEVCDYYGIPVIDMYAESLLNPWLDYDRTNWVPDGTHPNKAGHEHMEVTCIAALRKYLPTL